MTTLIGKFSRFTALVAAFTLVLGVVGARSTTITIVNGNAAGVGFNDATPVAPIGGNPGTTLGAQRLYLFQYAANIWASTLNSAVPIQVSAQMSALTCTATSATLGSTGSNSVHRDFANAPFPTTWYVQSLANKLAGTDLNTTATDMSTTFNSALDAGAATCLGGETWYYGLDNNPGVNQVQLLPVVLHELAHGLNFATTTSGSSGNYQSSYPNVFDHFLYDDSLSLYWNQETAAQRKASAIAQHNLVWNGPNVGPAAAAYLAKRPHVAVNSPPSIAGSFDYVGTASFGPALGAGGVTGDVVLVQDITAPTSDGCETFVNGPALAGKVALVDRGVCAFVAKAESCQAYGAIAVLIVNNVAGVQPPGGSDPAITIPVVGIRTVDGAKIKTALLGGPVNVTLGLDPVYLAGADNSNRPLMYTPNPYSSGSTVSHWDVSLTPNALMEPAINPDLYQSLDLTPYLFWDIGWQDFATATQLSLFRADDVNGGILLTWEFSSQIGGAVTLERATSAIGPWAPVGVDVHVESGLTKALDTTVAPSIAYYYRLSVMDAKGNAQTYGLAAGRHAAGIGGPAALFAPSPNPAAHGSSLAFRLSSPEFVRMSIVDASGRSVRTLANAMMLPGEHVQLWDGRSDSGRDVAPGLYFVTLRTSKTQLSQRLAVVQ